MFRLQSTPLDPGAAYRDFAKAVADAGAIVTFTGVVRPDANGAPVRKLTLEAYSPLTEREAEAATAMAESRWPLLAAMAIHRVGDMAPGDPIVFVATASRHRRAAFEAADFLMDYLKTEAVFWKKEWTDAGAHWIEPRPDDHADRRRWG
ncbi:MAG: molybdenum cofactor biosynthesis protein MoaE [Alphaproteobacteria bacterium]|nr:molybdenum cofactor biosynthesis protein MoaE [Alphaproteobacteria bacterium]